MNMINKNKDCAVKESIVKDLQSVLFPISPRKSTSDYILNNWYHKSVSSNIPSMNINTNIGSLSFIEKVPNELLLKEISSTTQPPRWPTECQVLEKRVSHIMYTSITIESYYTVTGKEVQPKPVGDDCGIVIYQYYPISAVNYFSRSNVGGSKYLLSTCPSPDDDSLRFESRFESGNLAKAIKITNTYYELYLRTDLYTNRHMQWFYFRITNMKKINTYRFSIVNLMKDDSLYNEGMRPLMYSVKDAQLSSLGWRRCGSNIAYYSNENMNPEETDEIIFNTLTFTIEFPHDDDTIYLAHSYPYTYSDLQDYLDNLNTHPIKSTYTNIRLLCKSLAGNNVHYITVTSPDSNTAIKKKAIVVTARVHPGETPASWMMKGILDFITSDSRSAKELRDRFVFKIVPMLNPDGVIVGNNRCSLTGKDLNRQYRTVIRESYPSIWYTKLMIRRLLEECGVAMYCDLHAHSRKHNIFVYGCENRRNVDKHLQEQVFPLMLHKNAAGKFSFEDCVFRIQRNKEGTGRIVMWMMGICYSYTLEASFGGCTLGSKAENHFSTMDYEQMGKAFCQTLLDFYDDDPRKDKLRSKIVIRLLKCGSNADEPANINLTDYSSDNGDTSSNTTDNEDTTPLEKITEAVPSSTIITVKDNSENNKRIRQKPTKFISTDANRKSIQVCKATLDFSREIRKEKKDYETSSNSDIVTLSNCKIKAFVAMKQRKWKKNKKKKKQIVNEKDENKNFCENISKEQTIEKKSNEKYISVLHMSPENDVSKIILWQESLFPIASITKQMKMDEISKCRIKSQLKKATSNYNKSYNKSNQHLGKFKSRIGESVDCIKCKIMPNLILAQNENNLDLIHKEKVKRKNKKVKSIKKCKIICKS